jgi:hypothetical protein
MADLAEQEPLEGIKAVNHVLEVCGFANEGNCASVRSEGFTQVSDFGVMRASNFASMAGRISKLRPQAGGFHLGKCMSVTLRLEPIGFMTNNAAMKK